ncbi:MAG: S9 family peptidase [Anaerolineae bacterium]|nr:S9 family peptidase [Anaerolineae bacterium]
MTKEIRQYGTWPSPVSAKMLSASLSLRDVQWDTDGETLVWLENRGAQGVLVMQQGVDAPCDLTSDLSVRGRVGYGGGDFTVAQGQVYFAGPEGRLYKQALAGGAAQPIAPAFGACASPAVSADGCWLAYVNSYERRDSLAMIATDGKSWPVMLASGTDFVMQPTWHPQGNYLAYVAWNHPQMPWDGTELHLITFADDGNGMPVVSDNVVVAGSTTTAIFQPAFSPDGRYLAYVSDESGWGQLYLYDLEKQSARQLTDAQAEHGMPAWGQGMRSYGWSADSKGLFYIRNEQAIHYLWYSDIQSGRAEKIDGLEEYTHLSQPAVSPGDSTVALIASASDIPARVITYRDKGMEVPAALNPDADSMQVLVSEGESGLRIHRRSSSERLLKEQISMAEAITWTGHDGEVVHGLYYAPTNDRFKGIGQPPLIVKVHGGPTSQVLTSFDGGTQFFTSRGFALLNVNYRGSTGYGKSYMNMLIGNWGIYDVEDSASGAAYLAQQGLADASKLVIMGGSAGGFTVLQSLIDKPGFYKAGICSFGVSNQFLLAMDTHKFEERYLDSMLGPLPEAAAVYRERSPYFHADRLVDPIAVFQGEEDQVVPRQQSDDIVASLRARGVPHEYHIYAGEGHGWRKPETIEAYYGSVLKFLTQYVLFS